MSVALSLDDGTCALPSVKVHPTAIFGILNHFSRRSDLDTRVIGTLLGTRNGNEIEITDCYGVPFVEEVDEIKIKINQDYHNQMYKAHRRISKKEEIMGWYSTTATNGAFITNTSSVINSFYMKQCEDSNSNNNKDGESNSEHENQPVHLVIDSTLQNRDSMAVRAFLAKPITLDDTAFADMFEEISVELVMSPAEKTALYHMMLGDRNLNQNNNDSSSSRSSSSTVFQTWDKPEITSALPSELNDVQNGVEQLLHTIDDLQLYVDSIINGKTTVTDGDGIPEIGVELAHALSSLSSYKQDEITAQLHGKIQDQIMIAYLSTLTKAQAHVSEKLHAIL
jgi:translation initiation factor 3 subunit F